MSTSLRFLGACDSYCEHGGICILDLGHDGLHDSQYCQWENGISRAEADEKLRENGALGSLVADLWDDIFQD